MRIYDASLIVDNLKDVCQCKNSFFKNQIEVETLNQFVTQMYSRFNICGKNRPEITDVFSSVA